MMMRLISVVVVYLSLSLTGSVSVAVVPHFTSVSTPSVSTGAFLWQGFDHQWEHKELGFQTPHRMGSIESRLVSENFSADSSNATAEFHLSFTPGVNGDFAHPSTRYSILQGTKGSVEFARFTVSTQFADKTTTAGDIQFAESSIRVSFQLPVTDIPIRGVVLSGFSLDMQCAGESCNSNGVWPYLWRLSVDGCGEGSKSTCELQFDLNRGWTPSHGGGKALNAVMEYSLDVELLAVLASDETSVTSGGGTVQSASTLFEDPLSGTVDVKFDADLSNHDQPPVVVAGLTTIGFQLLETKNQADLGRYFEHVSFGVSNPRYSSSTSKSSADWTMNVGAPKLTTYACDLTYELGVEVLGFQPSAVTLSAQDETATGAVCESDKSMLFSCKRKGMEEKLSDVVVVSSSSPPP